MASAVSTYPVHFHVGMVRDLKGAVSGDVDMSEDKAIEKAEEELRRARLESFQAHFEKDLVTLKRAIHGHGLLQDNLAWMAHLKRKCRLALHRSLWRHTRVGSFQRWSRIETHWWATFRMGWARHFQLCHGQQVHQPLQWILWLKHMLWLA